MSFSLASATVLITGVGRANGIGQATIRALLAAGAPTVIGTVRQAGQLAALQQQFPGRVSEIVVDLTDAKAIAELPRLTGPIQVLINNAGLFNGDTALAEGDGEAMFAVNYLAPKRLVRAYATHLANGAVINVNSVAGLVNFPICAVYSDTKAALNSLTAAQRRELSPQKTLVMSVYPGPIATDMGKDVPFETTPPEVVGEAIVAGLRDGAEEVFPDPMAQTIAKALAQDRKGLERSFWPAAASAASAS
jgi:NAD(P)-dependent dehydrogenase (short-subunit alcohol dehydrogenase family)